jgi:tetratricopeptide (TPR) repeat protein
VNVEAEPFYKEGRKDLRQESRADEAISLLKLAAKLDPGSAPVWAALAQAYFVKYRLNSDSRYLELSQETTSRAKALNPDSPLVHMISGLLLLDSGHYSPAAEEFQRTVDLDPSDADGWRRLGRAYERGNEREKALKAFQRAIQAEPTYHAAYRWLGAFYYGQAEYERAVEQFSRSVDLMPGAPEGHFDLAAAYVRLGRYKEAEHELGISLELRETLNTLISLGAVLVFERRDADAIPYYQRAGELAPNYYLIWMNLADAYRRTNALALQQQAYKRAHQLCRKVTEGNPSNANVLAAEAYLLARLGNAEDAKHVIAQALAFPSADADTVQMAVRVYEALGERKLTIKILKEKNASRRLLEDIARLPEMEKLRDDRDFKELLNQR